MFMGSVFYDLCVFLWCFNFPSLSVMFTVGVQYMVFYCVVMLFFSAIFERFYHEMTLCFIEFHVSGERIIWFSYFILLTWCIMLIALCVLNHLCILGVNPWIMIFFRGCWIHFLVFGWGFFVLCSWDRWFCSFLIIFLSRYDVKVIPVSQNVM